MLQIPTKTKPAYNAGNILTLNQKSQCLASPVAPAKHSTPQLRNLIQKGQKVRIGMVGQLPRLRVALGWNVSNLQWSSRYIRYRMYPSQNSGRAAFPHPALYETHYSTIIRKY